MATSANWSTSGVTVRAGDTLLTPNGEEQVGWVDVASDMVHTATGSWRVEDLEAIPDPDTSDVEAVEWWLRIAGQVIPRLNVINSSTKCECDCTACYRVTHSVGRNDAAWAPPEVNVYHFKNNATCTCPERSCRCC